MQIYSIKSFWRGSWVSLIYFYGYTKFEFFLSIKLKEANVDIQFIYEEPNSFIGSKMYILFKYIFFFLHKR